MSRHVNAAIGTIHKNYTKIEVRFFILLAVTQIGVNSGLNIELV